MPRSVSIYPDRKQTIEDSLKRNGFLTQGDFAAHIGKAVSTVNNFFTAKKVAISTFEEICEALGLDKREIQKPLESSQDKAVKETSEIIPTLYNPEKWVGRSQLIEKLLNQLQQNTRIVWLTGLSGIGKTTLGECIAVKAWENDPSFQWLHLEISASQLPDFATGAREILSQLGEKELDPQEMNDPKRLGDRLLKKLQSSFYWLQIDALEKLISANEFIDSYWLTFLENCLNTNHFPSRLLLTSQVLPNSLMNWCDRFSNIWYKETLKGLENEESEQYFAKNGIIIDESNQETLTCISQIYEGHPLVLQVIAGEILQVYQGDVTAYWKVNKAEFEQVSRELKSSRLTETDYNEQLARRVRERVKKSLEQLPKNAIALLCRSAVYRRPVPKSFWLGLINEYSSKEQNEAYRVLGDRALIETERNLIRLHNLVRDIAYDWLREDEAIWKAAEVKAAELWLNDYQPEENAENLEKVRGYLEAFYHYCDPEEWEKASELFMKSLGDSDNSRLSWQLDIWGYYEEEIKICQSLLGKSTKQIDAICWYDIGNAYLDLGSYSKSIESYHNSLNSVEKFEDRGGKANTFGNLGIVYFYLGKYQVAIDFFQQKLVIAREINDLWGESNALGNLGNAFRNLGQYKQAIDYYNQALFIHKKIGDRRGEGNVLGSMGLAFRNQGQCEKAIDVCSQHLVIAKEIGDRRGENIALGNLGLAYCDLGKYNSAIDCHHKQLRIAKEIGDRRGEGNALGSLGLAYFGLEQYKLAIIYSQEYLTISRNIGYRRGEGIALGDQGKTEIKLKKYAEAFLHLQASLRIFQDINFLRGEAEVLKNLAELYHETNQPQLARQQCKQALQISTELGISLAKECQELLSKIEEEAMNAQEN